MESWTARQTYIDFWNAMNACAELQIDCTPMERFDSDDYNQKLGLTEQGLNACALMSVGYRHSEDATQNVKKVRKFIDTIFEERN